MATDMELIELAGEDFLEDLKKLLSLSPETIRLVAEVANTDEGLDTSDETVAGIVRETKIDSRTIFSALRLTLFLRKRSSKRDIPIDGVMSELAAYCEAKQLSDYGPSLEAARSLIEMKEAFIESRRRSRVEDGVLYSLKSVSAVQDLRAVFNDDEVKELVPILLMRLTLENDMEEEKRFSFQMTKTQFEKFQKAVEEYKEDVDKLEKYLEGVRNE